MTAIPTKLKVFPRPTEDADISGSMGIYKPPPEDNVRKEIREILNKITDSETLLFFLWMLKKIARYEEVPQPTGVHQIAGQI